ncbi:MAG: sigma 54-interacting transcriptional regulator [Spirochaetia bacterium]|jgi:propionate catabolism operon transcriptional regulator|nr:sigma 54-interacting transcriptional regulator [Spirochaetia bacterium]
MIPYKIHCLTYKTLDKLVKQVLSQYSDPEVEFTILEGALLEFHEADIMNKLHIAEEKGCEVIIAGGSNANIAQEHCNIPVVEYRLTAYDYLAAIDKASVYGGKVAFCSYRRSVDPALLSWLDKERIAYTNIIYDTEDDLREQMLAHRGEVIIGTAFPINMAMQLGFNHVLIYPGEESVLVAFRDAKMIAMQIRRQNEYNQFAQAVIHNSPNGLVLVNSEGLVIETNKAARQFFHGGGDKAENGKGQRAEDLFIDGSYRDFRDQNLSELTEVRKIHGEPIFHKWLQLTGRSQNIIGSVCFLSNVSEIIQKQYDYRKKQQEENRGRGFVAKMRFKDILGSSEYLQRVKAEARLIAKADSNVIILGETGVGKEIFAQSIHNESSRKNEPFIAINCAALPEPLLESELFGYEEGAFTGSKKGGKKGLFEFANRGTMFLDEIGELSMPLQSRLLRVLQEHEIRHVGGDRIIPVDVRVISATNKDLSNLQNTQFRADLYYRLNVLELYLPPLRDRDADSIELFEFFLQQRGSLYPFFKTLPEAVKRVIKEYTWYGNIRELQNVSERFLLYLGENTESNPKYLARSIIRAIGEERLFNAILQKHHYISGESDEWLIVMLQEIMGYNKTQVSEKLGISRTTLWRKINQRVAAGG